MHPHHEFDFVIFGASALRAESRRSTMKNFDSNVGRAVKSSRRLVGTIAVALACLSSIVLVGTPAQAATAATSTTIPFSLPAAGGGGLAAQYNSLAGGMLNYWAAQNQMTLSQYVQSNAGTLASLVGSQSAASLSQAAAAGHLTMPQINAVLSQPSNALNLSGVTNMEQLMTTLAGSANTVDGQAILTGAQIASILGAQQVAAAAATSTPTSVPVGAPHALKPLAAPSSDSLIFGVFYDRTLAQLVNHSPGLLAQVQGSGLGSAAQMAQWNRTLAAAGQASQTSLSGMPDPCGVSMLRALGGAHVAATGSCGSCALAGTYLHGQMGRLFNPASNSVLPSTSGVNPSSWSSMQNWLQQATVQQNAGVANQVSGNTAAASAGNACAGSSSATSGVLSTTLPGVFSNLGR